MVPIPAAIMKGFPPTTVFGENPLPDPKKEVVYAGVAVLAASTGNPFIQGGMSHRHGDFLSGSTCPTGSMIRKPVHQQLPRFLRFFRIPYVIAVRYQSNLISGTQTTVQSIG